MLKTSRLSIVAPVLLKFFYSECRRGGLLRSGRPGRGFKSRRLRGTGGVAQMVRAGIETLFACYLAFVKSIRKGVVRACCLNVVCCRAYINLSELFLNHTTLQSYVVSLQT